jgi:hypothetical protein
MLSFRGARGDHQQTSIFSNSGESLHLQNRPQWEICGLSEEIFERLLFGMTDQTSL